MSRTSTESDGIKKVFSVEDEGLFPRPGGAFRALRSLLIILQNLGTLRHHPICRVYYFCIAAIAENDLEARMRAV